MDDLFSLEHLAFLALGAGLAVLMTWRQDMRIDRRHDVQTLQLHRRRRPIVRVARVGRKRR